MFMYKLLQFRDAFLQKYCHSFGPTSSDILLADKADSPAEGTATIAHFIAAARRQLAQVKAS